MDWLGESPFIDSGKPGGVGKLRLKNAMCLKDCSRRKFIFVGFFKHIGVRVGCL